MDAKTKDKITKGIPCLFKVTIRPGNGRTKLIKFNGRDIIYKEAILFRKITKKIRMQKEFIGYAHWFEQSFNNEIKDIFYVLSSFLSWRTGAGLLTIYGFIDRRGHAF